MSARHPDERAPEPTASPGTGHPDIDARIADQAAARSRSGGVWSLGHLRICWSVLLGAGMLEAVVAGLTRGRGGILGVGVGTAVVGLFFTVSTVVIAKVGARNPKHVMKAALAMYLVKIIALGVVLVMIPRDGAIDTKWMAGAVAVGVFAWLGAHLRYVWTTKIFYVDPG